MQKQKKVPAGEEGREGEKWKRKIAKNKHARREKYIGFRGQTVFSRRQKLSCGCR